MPFEIVRNDIVEMEVDAIVNTANPQPTFAQGSDSAIYRSAGQEQLLQARAQIGDIKPGSAAVTPGFNLAAKKIIHTVATKWEGGNCGEEFVLEKCYDSVLKLATDIEAGSIAIPLIATGVYGFPKGLAMRIAIRKIRQFLDDHEMMIYLVVFDKESVEWSKELYGDIEEYISDNYVEDQKQEEYKLRGNRFLNRPNGSLNVPMAPIEPSEPMEPADVPLNVPMAPMERSIEDVVDNLDLTFMEMVFDHADRKGLSDVEVQKRSNLDRKAFSKLKCGTTKNPSKSTALAICIGLELNLDEAKDLLSRAGYAFSPCDRRDLIVKYFIERQAYDIYEINVALFEHGESSLGAKML